MPANLSSLCVAKVKRPGARMLAHRFGLFFFQAIAPLNMLAMNKNGVSQFS